MHFCIRRKLENYGLASFSQSHKLDNNKASILVTCLWIIMVLSILAMALTGLVFQEIRFVKAYQRMVVSMPSVMAATKTVFYLRQDDLTPTYDTMQELTKVNEVSLCASNFYKYYFVDKNNSADKDEIIDEGALINLNTASTDTLKRLPGMDEDLAENLVNSGLRPFNSINEVLLVEDMTKEKFLLFKDLVTVYGTGKININTANKEVFLALGLDEELIDVILRFRKEHKIERTEEEIRKNPEKEDEYGFSATAKILDDLRGFASLSLRQEQDFIALLSVLDVKSEYLRFNVIPVSGGIEGLHYSIIIYPPSKKILSWKEN